MHCFLQTVFVVNVIILYLCMLNMALDCDKRNMICLPNSNTNFSFILCYLLDSILINICFSYTCHFVKILDSSQCFLLCNNSVTWKTAKKACSELGGTLAVDNNQERHEALTKLQKESARQADAWIGGNTQPRHWSWLYNSKGI